jgi:hypothetical protein
MWQKDGTVEKKRPYTLNKQKGENMQLTSALVHRAIGSLEGVVTRLEPEFIPDSTSEATCDTDDAELGVGSEGATTSGSGEG